MHGSDGLAARADLVLVAAGVRPNAELATSAGIERGARGAIRVDCSMATTTPDVWAAGDCVETWHRILRGPAYLPLGTTAHKAYYPGARRIRLRVTADRQTGQLLGAQILGPWQAEVTKRIDISATALFAGISVDAISDLDLSYTPAFGSPWDAVQLAAQAWDSAP